MQRIQIRARNDLYKYVQRVIMDRVRMDRLIQEKQLEFDRFANE